MFCICGVMFINILFRGNVMGRVNAESDIYIPLALLRTEIPVPKTDGFVDGSDDFGKRAI